MVWIYLSRYRYKETFEGYESIQCYLWYVTLFATLECLNCLKIEAFVFLFFVFFLDAITVNHSKCTKGELKSRVQSFLRYAPDREGGSGRRKKTDPRNTHSSRPLRRRLLESVSNEKIQTYKLFYCCFLCSGVEINKVWLMVRKVYLFFFILSLFAQDRKNPRWFHTEDVQQDFSLFCPKLHCSVILDYFKQEIKMNLK